MKKRALITGITGQDGSYLSELLLKKNYQVTDIQANDEISTVTAKIVDKLGFNWGNLYWLLNAFLIISPIQEFSIGKNSRCKFTSK